MDTSVQRSQAERPWLSKSSEQISWTGCDKQALPNLKPFLFIPADTSVSTALHSPTVPVFHAIQGVGGDRQTFMHQGSSFFYTRRPDFSGVIISFLPPRKG